METLHNLPPSYCQCPVCSASAEPALLGECEYVLQDEAVEHELEEERRLDSAQRARDMQDRRLI
jgi:hypothetical protein